MDDFKDAFIRKLVVNYDVTLADILRTSRKTDFWRRLKYVTKYVTAAPPQGDIDMPTEFFQTLIKLCCCWFDMYCIITKSFNSRGFLGLISQLEKTGKFAKGLLVPENIGYKEFDYENPIIVDWGKGEVTDEHSIFYKEFKCLMDGMAGNFKTKSEELAHFLRALDVVIQAPQKLTYKILLKKNIFLYSVAERVEFIKKMNSKWDMTLGVLMSVAYSFATTYDFRKSIKLTRRSGDIFGVIYDAFHFKHIKYKTSSCRDLVKFMRNVYQHGGKTYPHYSDVDLYDALNVIAPGALLHIFKTLRQAKVLGFVV